MPLDRQRQTLNGQTTQFQSQKHLHLSKQAYTDFYFRQLGANPHQNKSITKCRVQTHECSLLIIFFRGKRKHLDFQQLITAVVQPAYCRYFPD